MGFFKRIKDMFTKQEEEIVEKKPKKMSTIFPLVLCDDMQIEEKLVRWTQELEIQPDEFTEILQYFNFEMPVILSGLNLFGGISMNCTGADGKKAKLYFHSDLYAQEPGFSIEENGRRSRFHSKESLNNIKKYLSD